MSEAPLQRLSSEYVELEDRLRLRGEDAQGRVQAVWLSQRLARRLLPALCRWLEGEAPSDPAHAELLQGFAQEAARAAYQPQPPVAPREARPSWLAVEIDLRAGPGGLHLTLRGQQADERACLDFGAESLRQWLDILHGLWRQAGWPEADWPAWLRRPGERPDAPADRALH